jgi:hypothetical protein
MNESIAGVVLGILGLCGVTYLTVKVRQNQRRLHRMVGVVDNRYLHEVDYLLGLADSGELVPYAIAATR